jgi:PadR family transcriptional regulator, regulatory protein PadR
LAKLAGKKILRDVFLALVRVHVLHHAARERIFGVEMMDELKRHGYDISPGTLYPLLHALEESRVLVSSQEVVDGKVRKYYRITRSGNALLEELQTKIGVLFDEVLERRPQREPAGPKEAAHARGSAMGSR